MKKIKNPRGSRKTCSSLGKFFDNISNAKTIKSISLMLVSVDTLFLLEPNISYVESDSAQNLKVLRKEIKSELVDFCRSYLSLGPACKGMHPRPDFLSPSQFFRKCQFEINGAFMF